MFGSVVVYAFLLAFLFPPSIPFAHRISLRGETAIEKGWTFYRSHVGLAGRGTACSCFMGFAGLTQPSLCPVWSVVRTVQSSLFRRFVYGVGVALCIVVRMYLSCTTLFPSLLLSASRMACSGGPSSRPLLGWEPSMCRRRTHTACHSSHPPTTPKKYVSIQQSLNRYFPSFACVTEMRCDRSTWASNRCELYLLRSRVTASKSKRGNSWMMVPMLVLSWLPTSLWTVVGSPWA